jgi:hypothetical protein
LKQENIPQIVGILCAVRDEHSKAADTLQTQLDNLIEEHKSHTHKLKMQIKDNRRKARRVQQLITTEMQAVADQAAELEVAYDVDDLFAQSEMSLKENQK